MNKIIKKDKYWEDPIVNEAREAGEELAKRAKYDLHIFFENLRNNAKKSEQGINKNCI